MTKITVKIKQALMRTHLANEDPPARENGRPEIDIVHLLEKLVTQLESRREEYSRTLEILRDKYIQDSETIKIGLQRLLADPGFREGLSDEKIAALKRLANYQLPAQEWSGNEAENMKACEQHLARLEKEIIEVLSGHFTN